MLELWIKILNIFDVSIVIDHCDKWEVMSLADSIIIVIMCWRYLYSTLNNKKCAIYL